MALAAVLLATVAAAQPGPRPDLVVQVGHSAEVTSLAFSPDGVVLASASNDETVKIWDVASGRLLRTLGGHAVSVSSVAFDAPGTLLASGDGDGIVRLWDTATGLLRLELGRSGHASPRPAVHAVAFSPDGATLASALSDRTVVLWDVATGQRRRTLAGHRMASDVERAPVWRLGGTLTVAFSPDGHLLASGGTDARIVVWEVASGSQRAILTGHGSAVRAIRFAASGTLVSGSADGTARIWEVATGRVVRTVPGDGPIALSADGTTLAISDGGTIKMVGVDDGRLQHEIPFRLNLGTAMPPVGHVLGVSAFAFHPSGTMLASGGVTGAVKIWDRASDVERWSFEPAPAPLGVVSFSPDGKWLAGAASGSAWLWDLASGVPSFVPGYGAYARNALGFTSDGRQIVTPRWVVDLDTRAAREQPALPEVHTSAVVSPDGTLLATGTVRGDIELRDVATRRVVRTLRGHTKDVSGLAFSGDGQTLVSVGWDVTVRVWDVASGTLRHTLDGSGGPPGPAFLAYQAVVITPDAGLIAAAGTGPTPASFGLSVWDVRSGAARHLVDQRWPAKALALSPDGSMLASVSDFTRSVQLWDLATLRPIAARIDHDHNVEAVAFSPDGRWLASTSGEGVTRLWRMPTGSLEATLIALDDGWLVATPSGLFDGSPGGWSRVLWRLGPLTLDVEPVEAFFAEYYAPGLLAEVLRGRPPAAPRALDALDRRRPWVSLALEPEAEPGPPGRHVRLRLTVAEAPPGAGHDKGGGARDVRLFRNGTLIKAWRGDVPMVDAAPATLQATVSIVAGPNRFTAYAFNRHDVKSEDATLVVTGDEDLQRAGTLHVVAIGIDRYSSPRFELAHAVDDVRDLALELKQRQMDLGTFEESRIRIMALVDIAATRANILSVLRRLAGVETGPPPADAVRAVTAARRAEPEDTVIIHFAGHGVADGDRFYLLPFDLGYRGTARPDRQQLEAILRRSVSDRDLEVALEAIDAARIVVIIDSCQSGKALEAADTRRGPLNSRGLAQLAWEKGASVLAAAQGYQAALESGQYGHGLLTYALVAEGLRTAAADRAPTDGVVDLREWFDYAARRVPQLQLELMRSARQAGRDVAIVDGEESIADLTRRTLQQPRVFYRREPDSVPFELVRP